MCLCIDGPADSPSDSPLICLLSVLLSVVVSVKLSDEQCFRMLWACSREHVTSTLANGSESDGGEKRDIICRCNCFILFIIRSTVIEMMDVRVLVIRLEKEKPKHRSIRLTKKRGRPHIGPTLSKRRVRIETFECRPFTRAQF